MTQFTPNCKPLLLGSLPVNDHLQATEIILKYIPGIPLWPQLPCYPQEGMLLQFLPGLPGITTCENTTSIVTNTPDFDDQFLAFYEEYLLITEADGELDESRFALTPDTAQGFFTFLDYISNNKPPVERLKGQITGPITFCTGLKDQDGRAIYYNEQLRDCAIKLLALKAQWQTRKLAELIPEPIMFFDEPALAALGSSAFITITGPDIVAAFSEAFEGVRKEGGLTGIHVCANTEWSIMFDTGVDIISFDAYSYFDKLILYPEQLIAFFKRGGILASGIIPTTADLLSKESCNSLVEKWFGQLSQLEDLGIDRETICKQTLITPSCGTGSVSLEQSIAVLEMTKDVSAAIQEKI